MIIFLYGENTYLSRQKLKKIKEKFIKEVDPGENNLITLDGRVIDQEKIDSAISSRSLLSAKQMIVIEDIFLNKNEKILNNLASLLKYKQVEQGDNIIVFWSSNIKTKQYKTGLGLKNAKKNAIIIDSSGREKPIGAKASSLFAILSSQKYAQEFKPLSNLEIVRFIKKQSESLGGVISNQAAQLLISLIGNNLWQIENELNKLVNYKFLKTPKLFKTKSYVKPPVIEIEDVKQLVRGNLDENIFALTDAISNKNRKLAAELIEDQNKAGLSDGHILTMVIRQFRILMQVRQALDSGFTSKKIISSLKLHPFVAQKGINQVRNFNLIYLKKTFDDLINIEYKTKLGQTSAKLMLNLLISKI